jgi:hypothetical protein
LADKWIPLSDLIATAQEIAKLEGRFVDSQGSGALFQTDNENCLRMGIRVLEHVSISPEPVTMSLIEAITVGQFPHHWQATAFS